MNTREAAEKLVNDWEATHRFTRRIDGPLDPKVKTDLIERIANALDPKPAKTGKKEAVK